MRRLLTLATLVALLPLHLSAQSQFRTVASVDGDVISAFELNQRVRFLEFVRTPGADREFALNQLIEDRLRLAAARRSGIELSEEGMDSAMEEFAGRADLTVPEFISRLNAEGIEETTFRAFLRAGVTWREVVRSRFLGRAQISEEDIDRALAQTGTGSSIRVLLNEIFLPARPGLPEVEESERIAERLQRIRSISAFQAEAAELSVAPSRENGGRVDWLNLSELPQQLGPILLDLSPGEVTEPLRLPNTLLLFQLRAIEERERDAPAPAAIDYAALYLPGGLEARGRAAQIASRVDTCDDLYGVAKNMPPEALERGAKAADEIPQDVAIELAKLDTDEISTALTRANGDTLVLLMLCSRIPSLDDDTDRDAISSRLRSQRLAGFADSFLAELRAEAVITIE
ncbi:MAG: peptidylprolyl isomerase [Pseudomonadota bacterium]